MRGPAILACATLLAGCPSLDGFTPSPSAKDGGGGDDDDDASLGAHDATSMPMPEAGGPVDMGAPDPNAIFVCAASGAKVSDCVNQCAGAPIKCTYCGAGPILGACINPDDESCGDEIPSDDYDTCGCLGPAGCPNDDQICLVHCRTCGDTLTDGLPCKGGGSCNRNLRKCVM